MALTRADFARIARNRIRITPDAQLDPASVDKTGSTVNIFVNAVAAIAEELEARSSARFAAQLVASARGADLDRLILERSKGKLPRKGAAAATLDLQLYRTSTAAGEGLVEAGTEILAGGLTWTLDTSAVFAATSLGAIPATATCATLGTRGNGVAPDVQKFKNAGALFDATLVVESFGIPSAGGDERETDEAYRARYALWDAGLDRNLEFLAAGTLGVPGVATATAVEDTDAEGTPTGAVTLYLGDANGRATSALLARVRASARGFRLAGQAIRFVGTSPDFRAFSLRFGILDSFSADQVREEARAALVAYVNGLAPGASLLRASLAAVLTAVPGVVLLDAHPYGLETGSPSDVDLIPSSKSTLYRTRPELVTFP
jgi:uncharacterized phage protein gp47/JayE